MELFKLFGSIAIKNTDAIDGIDETVDAAEASQSKLSTAFGKIGSFALKCGQVIASGLAVGAAAIGALAKRAIDSYAEYEQLVGGIETLFGAGGKSLEQYAASVGKSAQLAVEAIN